MMQYLHIFNGIDPQYNGKYPSGMFSSDTGTTHPRRVLPHFVLLMGRTGQFDIMQDGEEYHLLPNTYLFLIANHEHYGTKKSEPGISEYFCNFTISNGFALVEEDEAQEIAYRIINKKENPGFEFIIPLYAQIASPERCYITVQNLIETQYINDTYKKTIADSSANILLAYLSENYIDSLRYKDKSASYLKIHSIIKFIRFNIGSELRVSEIAAHFNYTPNYLTELFKKVTGYSLLDYINRQKIATASTFLLNTDKTVKEVAYICGFNDPKYFSKVFKKYKSVEPTKFRNAYYDMRMVEQR